MATFSERMGLVQPKNIVQKDGMDGALRTGLWNCMTEHIFPQLSQGDSVGFLYSAGGRSLMNALYHDHFRARTDQVPTAPILAIQGLSSHYFQCKWHEAYDLIEFFAKNADRSGAFRNACNKVLQRELSGYRFVSGHLVPISDGTEVDSLEAALGAAPTLPGVRKHLQSALQKYADRTAPDYANAVKEAIGAVEALVRALTGTSTLGDGLQVLRNKPPVVPQLILISWEKMWGHASATPGTRHGSATVVAVTQAEAHYVIITASAFINYLVALCAEQGVATEPKR